MSMAQHRSFSPRRPTLADALATLAYRAARLAVLTTAGAVAIAAGLVLADTAARWLHPDEYPSGWEDME